MSTYWILIYKIVMDILVIIVASHWRTLRNLWPTKSRQRTEAINDIKAKAQHDWVLSKSLADETVLREMAIFAKGPIERHLREGSIVLKDACINVQHSNQSMMNFVIDPNSCCGILGLAGSGKSAIMKIIRGEWKLDYGDVYVNGVSGCHPSEIGYFSKSINLPHVLQVSEILLIHAELRKVPLNFRRGAVETLAAIFGMNEFLRK